MRENNSKLRRQIAWDAARLMYDRTESEFHGAKLNAARRITKGSFRPTDLPNNAEIRDQIRVLARMHEGDQRTENQVDRFQVYESLLLPLEDVKQQPKYHPEGDALYHSLQVYDLALGELPYDEEFLLAALLHDVGKAIDPHNHVAAGLHALNGFIGERTRWLIEHHMLAHDLRDAALGARARSRLRRSENFDDLVLLGDCDRAGRQTGVEVSELDDVLDSIRSLAGE